MTVREKIEKGFELANYLVLTLLITAQCTVGSNFLQDSLYTLVQMYLRL